MYKGREEAEGSLGGGALETGYREEGILREGGVKVEHSVCSWNWGAVRRGLVQGRQESAE